MSGPSKTAAAPSRTLLLVFFMLVACGCGSTEKRPRSPEPAPEQAVSAPEPPLSEPHWSEARGATNDDEPHLAKFMDKSVENQGQQVIHIPSYAGRVRRSCDLGGTTLCEDDARMACGVEITRRALYGREEKSWLARARIYLVTKTGKMVSPARNETLSYTMGAPYCTRYAEFEGVPCREVSEVVIDVRGGDVSGELPDKDTKGVHRYKVPSPPD